MALDIEKIAVGPLQANCFLITEPQSKEALLIDPGDEPDRILAHVERLGAKLKAIVLTHSHGDHIGAVEAIKNRTGVPVMIHQAEADWITDPGKNLSALLGIPVAAPPADRLLNEGDTISIGSENLKVLHTPGHSPGGLSLYRNGILLSGDLIFRESVGRTDLPGGDPNLLIEVLKTKILTLPDETLIYPGHGEATTVGSERKRNPFLTF